MPSKPSQLPTWCASSTSNRIEPDAAKQQGGWLFAEKPPAQWMNWWMHNVYSWVDYLNTMRASDVPATYGGNANSTVQAAIDGLGARISALPLAGSVGLTHVTPPSANVTTPDLWSGASGGICVPFVHPNGVASSVLYPEFSGTDRHIVTATTWPKRDAVGAGLVFKNLHIAAPVSVSAQRSAFVLRVHGDLRLDAPLSFNAFQADPASYTRLAGQGYINEGGWGGAGVLACGGSGGTPPSPVAAGTNDPRLLQMYNGYSSQSGPSGPTGALEDLIQTLPGLGGVGVVATWLRGGGAPGGAYGNPPGTSISWTDCAAGGGVAVIYVSGDVYFGANTATGTRGKITCSGEDGRAGSATKPGGGGGGGGAVFLICGGRLLTGQGALLGADEVGLIQANGGAGNSNALAGGGGGGGGLVYVAARNAHAMHSFIGTFSATGGAGGANSSSSRAGQAGFPGSVVIMRAIPRLMA